MINIIYILASALKHRVEVLRLFQGRRINEVFYDPKGKTVYGKHEPGAPTILVDNNIASGSTIFNTLQYFREIGIEISAVYANVVGDVKLGIKIHRLQFATPRKQRIIFFSGKPGTGKTAFAKTLAERIGAHFIKWGEFVSRNFTIGKFGEKIDAYTNDFIIPLKFIDYYSDIFDSDRDIVIDGIKTKMQVITLSYVTRRPPIVFFVQVPEHIRQQILKVRQMSDDKFAIEREKFFEQGFEELRNNDKVITIDASDWTAESTYSRALKFFFGIEPPKLCNEINLWFTKRNLLKQYYKATIKAKPAIHSIWPNMPHVRYVERIERKFNVKLNKEQRAVIILTATGFRIIDDILDEDNVRDNHPAYWVTHGIYPSITDAITMTASARGYAKKLGLLKEFDTMFSSVVQGVDFELQLEERPRRITIDEWIFAAQKETAYRWFIAHLIDKPEIATKMYLLGLIAQAKDDLLGQNKYGRHGHEQELHRPLIQNCINTKVDLEKLDRLKTENPGTIKEANLIFKQALLS